VTSGEVVLCVDEAARQAAEQGHTVAEELLLYAVHGLLHLCGYDDRTPADFAVMHAREDEILTHIGVGRLFKKHTD
jgi:probable rRNA maturation factor